MLFRLAFLLAVTCCCHGDETNQMTLIQHYSNNWEGEISFDLVKPIVGWEIQMKFNKPVSDLHQYEATIYNQSSDGTFYAMTNRDDAKGIKAAGTQLKFRVTGHYDGGTPPSATVTFIDLSADNQTPPPVTTPHGAQHTKYNYAEVITKSIMFYEAQRSGKLPVDNRISWRGDSALTDQGDNGEYLSGGWYDAGDYVKFGLPMAWSTTILEWGLLEWPHAYEDSGNEQYIKECVRWTLNYFLKCHVAPHKLYVQVGNGGTDHGHWGRAENMTMSRPAYAITESKPGSDVAAETAAAMAAGYLIFKQEDPTYAQTLLTHAKQLYEFADKFRAKYSQSVNQAAGFYTSNAYEDELVWGALWLYQATKDPAYLAKAEAGHSEISGAAWGDSWDDKQAASNLLLYKFTKKDTYKQDILATFKDWMPGGSLPYTPGGMAFRLQWGALRYTSNMALVALMAADAGINPQSYRCWAMSQINYALGDNPNHRSYVVGFGNNPPQRPHHRGASCPAWPAPCGFNDQNNPGPSPHTLYGALVGGPGRDDSYKDDRKDYVKNEVACDYNAGFQSANAGLLQLAIQHKLPNNCHSGASGR